MEKPIIGVYGARGYTAGLVIRDLADRGFRLKLGARNEPALYPQEVRGGVIESQALSLDDPASVERFLRGCAVVVNCAGPFAATAPVLAEGAAACGAHYIDVTGEPPVVQRLRAEQNGRAQLAGTAILPAMGFFGALPDLMATMAAGEWSEVDRVTIAYALTGWVMTPGSKNAAAGLAGQRPVFTGGRMEIRSGAPVFDEHLYPAPVGRAAVMREYPAPETILLPFHLARREVAVLMTASTLAELRGQGGERQETGDRTGTEFIVAVDVVRDGAVRRVLARGRDIYGITAPIVGEAVERLVASNSGCAGVLAPGQIFAARSFLQAVAARHGGLTVEGI